MCPCKSGLKYKKCCNLNEKEFVKYLDTRITEPEAIVHMFNKDKIVRQCLHPNNAECKNEQVIGAHSIARKRILDNLQLDGKVKKIYLGYNNQQMLSIKIKGIDIKRASVFFGFCKKHDDLFQPIDNFDFYPEDVQQNFLFSYRAFCFEYHQLDESIKANQKLFLESKRVHEKVSGTLSMLNKQKNKLNEYQNKYNKMIINNNHSDIISKSFIYKGKAQIAVSSAIFPFYDIKNNEIADDIDDSKMITLNIFPQNEKTYVVFNWFNIDNSVFSNFISQFEGLNLKDQISFLNNTVTLYARRSLLFNPTLWSELTTSEKHAVKSSYNPAFISLNNLLRTPQYNLFKNIESLSN